MKTLLTVLLVVLTIGATAGFGQSANVDIANLESNMEVGQTYYVTVRMRNSGEANPSTMLGMLHVSFRKANSEESPDADIRIVDRDGDPMFTVRERLDAGTSVAHHDGYTMSTDYLLLYYNARNWPANGYREARIQITPTEAGEFYIYFRGAFATSETASHFSDDPLQTPSCSYRDQQGWCVRRNRVTVTRSLPNMIITSLATNPASPIQGQPTALVANIQNIGAATASNIHVRFYVEGNYAGDATYPSLAAGAVAQVQMPGYVFASSGGYALLADIDAVQDEEQVDNNDRLTEVAVQESSGGGSSSGELFAHWPMDETSGNVVADASGNGHNGSAISASIATGQIGNCRSFNGSSSYINMGSMGYPPTTNTGTFACWFNVTNLSPSNGGFCNTLVCKSTYYTDIRFSAVWLYPDGSIIYGTKPPNSGAPNGVEVDAGRTTAPGLIEPNKWYHLAITADGTSTIRLYLNGEEVSTNSRLRDSYNRFFDFGDTVVIGKFFRRTANPGDFYFDGKIDDVRLYNRALNPAEVQRLWSGGPANQPPVASIQAYAADGSTGGNVVSDPSGIFIEFLIDNSKDIDGRIVRYELDTDGDGTFDVSQAAGTVAVVKYPLAGLDKWVTLRVTDDKGAFDEQSCHLLFSGFHMYRNAYQFTNGEMVDHISPVRPILERALDRLCPECPSIFKELLLSTATSWPGFCSGMASTSCTFYVSPWLNPFGQELRTLPVSTPLMSDVMAASHICLNAWDVIAPGCKTADAAGVSIELQSLQHALQGNVPMVMTMSGPSGNHSVTPYGFIDNTDDGYRIITYDNNFSSEPTTITASFKDGKWTIVNNFAEPMSRVNFLHGSLASALPSPGQILEYFQVLLSALQAAHKSRVTVACPVDAIMWDSTGKRIGVEQGEQFNEVEGAAFTVTNGVWSFEVPNDRSFTLQTQGTDSGQAHIGVYLTNQDGTADIGSYVIPVSKSSISNLALGSGTRQQFISVDTDGNGHCDTLISASAYSWNTSISEMSVSGSLTGAVEVNGTGVAGVLLMLADSSGTFSASTVTDSRGQFSFGNVQNGNYTVTIETPLGYSLSTETRQVMIQGLNVVEAFELSRLQVLPRQRTRAWWAHQLLKAIQGKPQDVTFAQFGSYCGLIDKHFNSNLLNPVDFYQVPQPASQADSLEVLRKLLHMASTGADEPFLKRLAKSELMALMLNVVSGKVHQTYAISKDGRTISQAITYCDMLVNDQIDVPDDNGPGCGSPWVRYLRASFILTAANLNNQVPAGMIPEDVLEIAYKRQQGKTLPSEFALAQNYPNPFNPSTTIRFALPEATDVKLEIFNITGQRVMTLLDTDMPAGQHEVTWDGQDAGGKEVASGVYLYRLQAGASRESKKMVLLK